MLCERGPYMVTAIPAQCQAQPCVHVMLRDHTERRGGEELLDDDNGSEAVQVAHVTGDMSPAMRHIVTCALCSLIR